MGRRAVASKRETIMSRSLGLMACLTMCCLCTAAQAADSDDQQVGQAFGNDQFVAGRVARIDRGVAGDLIAAGGRVEIEAPVSGDALVAGGDIRVGGNIGNGVYAAGGQVTIDATVGRNARVAGGQVELGPRGQVTGNATLAGGEVRVEGAVKGSLLAAGGTVYLDGPVEGDVIATAGHLELGPRARIGGKLRYAADELRRDPGAQVAGGAERFERPRDSHWRVHRHRGGGWVWTAGMMVLAALLAGALPAASERITAGLRAHPWLALLFGFIAFVCIPFAAMVLMITIIGIPLALLAILAYLALLLVGYAATAVALGEVALRRFKADAAAHTGSRIAAAILAVLVLALLVRVPFVGWLVALAAMLAGIGAIILALRPRAAPA